MLTLQYPPVPPSAGRARASKGAAFCLALSLALPLSAQTASPTAPATPTDEAIRLQEFVVSGVRASLMGAQEIKQDTSQFVDSIVAQDIGKLPDNTVADALQHVAGVQVGRQAGETNFIVIRGLPNIESTLNGYEVFTGVGRGVAYQDVPAEMLAGLEVYKSVNPDQIEGGVSGVIDIRLRRPLDFKTGLSLSANGRGLYGTQAKKYSEFLSGVANYRWKNSAGEFGVLFDVSYARRKYVDQIFDNYVHFPAPYDVGYDSNGVGGFYADNFGFQNKHGDRKRPAAELAFQWKTNSGVELYSETLFTGYKERSDNDFFIGIPSWGGTKSNFVLYPAGYAGVNITVPVVNSDGTPSGLPNAGGNARWVKSFTAIGTNTIISKQAFDNYTNTVQGAFGGKWTHEDLKLDAELSYNKSLVKTRGAILDTIATSPTQRWDLTYNDGSNITAINSGMDFSNPANITPSNFFDQWSRAESAQYALKVDGTYSFSNAFIKSVKVGVRYADRSVHFQQANPSAYFTGPSVPATSTPGLGIVSTNNLFVSDSDFNVRTWWSPSTDFLLDHTDTVRALAGHPLGTPPADPASTFNDREKNEALFGLVNYKVMLGSMALDGVAGARFVRLEQTTGAYQNALDANGSSIPGQFVPVKSTNSSSDILPTLNSTLHITDKLQLRFAATKTITRPNFADLNPALSLFRAGPTVAVGTGTGGNPKLEAIQSTNYDLSLEYYFTKSSQFTVTVFDHKLSNYLQSYVGIEHVGLYDYYITRPSNTGKGKLQGYELSYVQFLDFVSVDALKGLGVQLNYTGIDGTTTNPITNTTQDITQVAKKNYNAILIYEYKKFSSRLAYTWRGKYVDGYNQSGLQPTTVWVEPSKTLDFSASYAITKDLTITFDATNILKDKYKDHFGETQMFFRDVRSYDSTIAVGVRYNY